LISQSNNIVHLQHAVILKTIKISLAVCIPGKFMWGILFKQNEINNKVKVLHVSNSLSIALDKV